MYARFVELAKNPANPFDRNRYVYLQAAFEDEDQDVLRLVSHRVRQPPRGRRVAWAFLKPDFDAVAAKRAPH